MNRYLEIILWIVRIVLALIFFIAAVNKLSTPVSFVLVIQDYQVFGAVLSAWFAVLIPFLEIVLGILLITGFWLSEAFLLTAALYLIFDGMIAQAFIRGLDIACGCFGTSYASPINWWKIGENAILTAVAFAGLIIHYRRSVISNHGAEIDRGKR